MERIERTFGAHVQYRDWYGECKADDLDSDSLKKILLDRKLISESEYLIGITTFNGENSAHKPDLKPVWVTALVIPRMGRDETEAYLRSDSPPYVREVRLQMSVEEFARLFKRFSIAIERRDLGLVGKQYLTDENS